MIPQIRDYILDLIKQGKNNAEIQDALYKKLKIIIDDVLINQFRNYEAGLPILDVLPAELR